MLEEGIIEFDKEDMKTIKIVKEFEDDLYMQFFIRFKHHNDYIKTRGDAILIKDRKRLEEFIKRTGIEISWNELKEKDNVEVGDFVLKFYLIELSGLFGGDVYLKRLTYRYAEEDALFVFIDTYGWQNVLPCNKDDKFCFLFPDDYRTLFQDEEI